MLARGPIGNLMKTKTFRFGQTTTIKRNMSNTELQRKPSAERSPIKFSTSEANVNYRATLNFYGDTSDLPASHNYVITFSCVAAIIYLFLLRDDIEGDGGVNLFKPVHETIPELAIPMLKTAIAEHRKFGLDSRKLEKRLAECLKEPEKYGGNKPRKLVEN